MTCANYSGVIVRYMPADDVAFSTSNTAGNTKKKPKVPLPDILNSPEGVGPYHTPPEIKLRLLKKYGEGKINIHGRIIAAGSSFSGS